MWRLKAEAKRAPLGDEQVALPAESIRGAEGETVSRNALLEVGKCRECLVGGRRAERERHTRLLRIGRRKARLGHGLLVERVGPAVPGARHDREEVVTVR